MNTTQRFIKYFPEFYNISSTENFGKEVFTILKKIIKFKSGYIFYINPEKLVYSFNPEVTSTNLIKKGYIKEELKYKDTVFGILIIIKNSFTREEKQIFKSCASIIANITKDIEISNIIKTQTTALQNGYLEIKKANAKIKQSDEIKSKFLSHVSHELRTPINSILGFAELLGNEFVGKLNNNQKDYINDIKVSSVHLLEMINEILDMSKIEAGSITLNKKTFDIKMLSDEVINIIKPLIIKKNIKLYDNIKSFDVSADYQKLEQILFNLISNSIKFTPEHGEITIDTQKKEKHFIISVKDTGCGIAPKDHARIFKKFEQVNKFIANSTGLGLAITKELVKLHKGEITLISKPNQGATFIVTIPQ